jgi:hypothetical protein
MNTVLFWDHSIGSLEQHPNSVGEQISITMFLFFRIISFPVYLMSILPGESQSSSASENTLKPQCELQMYSLSQEH